MKKKTFYEQYRDKYKEIIEQNGGDLRRFLRSYGAKLNRIAKKKKKLKRRTKNVFIKKFKKFFSQDTFVKYRLVCISEEINEKVLLESFMNYFCEGDYDLPTFLQKLDNYNNSSLLYTKRTERREKRKQKALSLIKKQNIDKEWITKYTNINIEEIDF